METPACKPVCLIIIDTEGDNVWARPREATTRNAAYLPRFQSLCEHHGFIPTYLTNHEMAREPIFVDMARDALTRGTAEVGMHLHVWDTPPIKPQGPEDWHDQPYATDLPAELVDQKAEFMTRLLEDIFQAKITSHRAGRWGFSAPYARSLIRLGYEVDCSVTPGVSWAAYPGLRGGRGGVDYRFFPKSAYVIDPEDISRPGASPLLEVPMTVVELQRPIHRRLIDVARGRSGPNMVRFQPKPGNLRDLLTIVEQKRQAGADYLQFTLHSSEFMPGGSPLFKTKESIESLYRDLNVLFANIGRTFIGCGLTDYARRIRAGST